MRPRAPVDKRPSSAAAHLRVEREHFYFWSPSPVSTWWSKVKGHAHGGINSTPSRTYCIVGVKNVGGGGVVHDDDLGEVATQAAQVFDVIPPVKDAGLAEEAATESAPLIQEVRNRVCVLRSQTCW